MGVVLRSYAVLAQQKSRIPRKYWIVGVFMSNKAEPKLKNCQDRMPQKSGQALGTHC